MEKAGFVIIKVLYVNVNSIQYELSRSILFDATGFNFLIYFCSNAIFIIFKNSLRWNYLHIKSIQNSLKNFRNIQFFNFFQMNVNCNDKIF